MKYLSLLLFTLMASSSASGFQLYDSTKRLHPDYRDFTIYVSDTYYNFEADGQVPVSRIHTEGVMAAFNLLAEKADFLDYQFTFGGTYNSDEALANFYAGSEGAFHQKVYVDFTSKELWGRSGQVSASAAGRTSSESGDYFAGGIIRFNSDFVDWRHPLVNMQSTLIHEFLHLAGLDHSSSASSIMAYTEFWYPTLSADDLLALRNVYGIGNQSTVNITTAFDGGTAPGIEIVFIDKADGRSHTIMTNASGKAVMKNVPAGEYLVAARELSPTGPCFASPTRGFLTAFYVDDSSTDNDPANATAITIAADSTLSINLVLSKQTKNFDCHYIQWGRIAYSECGETPLVGNGYSYDKCYMQMAKRGLTYPAYIWNDLSMFHHKTDTDTSSGYHSAVVYKGAGDAPQISFTDATLADEANKSHKTNVTIDQNAKDGTYAVYCQAKGETALMSTFVEIQDFGTSTTNYEFLPDLREDMSSVDSPRNYTEYARSDSPAGGAFPGAGAGSFDDDEEEEDDRPRIFGIPCGTIGENSAAPPWTAFLLLFLPVCGLLVTYRH